MLFFRIYLFQLSNQVTSAHQKYKKKASYCIEKSVKMKIGKKIDCALYVL